MKVMYLEEAFFSSPPDFRIAGDIIKITALHITSKDQDMVATFDNIYQEWTYVDMDAYCKYKQTFPHTILYSRRT